MVEPSISAFNVLNFANFDGPGNRLSGVLNGAVGSINGTSADRSRGQSHRPWLGSIHSGRSPPDPVRGEAYFLSTGSLARQSSV